MTRRDTNSSHDHFVVVEGVSVVNLAKGVTYCLCHHLLLKIVLISLWTTCFLAGVFTSATLETYILSLVVLSAVYQVGKNIFFILGWRKFNSNLEEFNEELVTAHAPLVSILVPAYNEEAVIGATLRSLEMLEYANYEIIIIDDGSSDSTLEVVYNHAKESNQNIRVIAKANSGKANSLNMGFSRAQGEFVLAIDADTQIAPKTLMYGVDKLLKNANIAGVAGVVNIVNADSFLGQHQELEYSLGNLQKSTLALFGMTNVIPGPIGLFRKSVVIQLGGYTSGCGSFAEDTELTLRMISEGWRVSFEPRMVAFTQAPCDRENLFKQRYRWVRGTYQAVYKYLPSLLNSKLKNNRIFGLFLYCEQTLTLALEFGLLIYFVTRFLSHGDLSFFTVYLGLLIAVEVIAAKISLGIRNNQVSTIWKVLSSRFTYAIELLLWKLFAILEEWKHIKMDWDKVARYQETPAGTPPLEIGRAHG